MYFKILKCLVEYISKNTTKLAIKISISVQSLSRVRLFATPRTTACQASLYIINSRGLCKLMSIELVMLSNRLILCCPLLLLPSGFLPASGSFPVMWLFTSGGQNVGASTSASVLLMNIQGLFPLVLIDLISLLFKRLSGVFSNTTVWRHQFFRAQSFLLSSFHIHTWLLEKLQLWLFRHL